MANTMCTFTKFNTAMKALTTFSKFKLIKSVGSISGKDSDTN